MAPQSQPTLAPDADSLAQAKAEIRRLTVMLDCYGELLGNTIEAQVEHMTAARLNAAQAEATRRVVEAMRERGQEAAESADERLTKECERLRELAHSEERERAVMERELNKVHAEIERLRAELAAPKMRDRRPRKTDTPKT